VYPLSISSFFLRIVDVDETTNFRRLQYEVEQFGSRPPDGLHETVDYIGHVFRELSLGMERYYRPTSKELTALRACCMLPIRLPNSEKGFDRLCSARTAEDWFIADRDHMLESFGTVVPLLALSPDQISKAAMLLKCLCDGTMKERRLSRLAKVNATGVTEHKEYAALWTARAKYIDR
jgi:hypothetical protein